MWMYKYKFGTGIERVLCPSQDWVSQTKYPKQWIFNWLKTLNITNISQSLSFSHQNKWLQAHWPQQQGEAGYQFHPLSLPIVSIVAFLSLCLLFLFPKSSSKHQHLDQVTVQEVGSASCWPPPLVPSSSTRTTPQTEIFSHARSSSSTCQASVLSPDCQAATTF